MSARWMLAVLLAFLPAVCRCHIALHDHDDHVHLPSALSVLHLPSAGKPEAAHHHDHGGGHEVSAHHEHEHHTSAAEHDVLSLLLCEHGQHECDCLPLVTTVQKGNDLPQDALVALLPLNALSIHSFPAATPARVVLRQREHIPRPPTALVRLRCALII